MATVHATIEPFEQGPARRRDDLAQPDPRHTAIMSGVPFANGAPKHQLRSGVHERLAEREGVPIGGTDISDRPPGVPTPASNAGWDASAVLPTC